MLTFTDQRPITTLPQASLPYLNDEMLLFDLETTGLSASRNRIYMAGLGWLAGSDLTVCQLMTESADEEADLLAETLRIAGQGGFTRLVTFNGASFDLPFFAGRINRHQEALSASSIDLSALSSFPHHDLYRQLKPIRCYFPMEHHRQKDYEALLGISREDKYDGGKLVPVYHRYEKTRQPADCDLLRLHNKEDLFGMFHLLSLLACLQARQGQYRIESIQASSANDLSIRLSFNHPLPVSVRHLLAEGSLLMRQKTGLVVLPLYQGKLKKRLADPQNYFYLTEEGTVVHKSLGQFVDPAFRRKARPEECYIDCPVPPAYLDGEIHPFDEGPFFRDLRSVLDGFLTDGKGQS